MARLVWDSPGQRYYETGLDRGVLYTDGGIVPWNGLVSVSEDTSRDIQAVYHDGVKISQSETLDGYKAKVEAFTFPVEFEQLFMGAAEHRAGVFVHEQRSKPFSLSYRTRIGNDQSQEAGYRIHVIQNTIAVLGTNDHGTADDSPGADSFSWDITAIPQFLFSPFRPAAHISFNTAIMPSEQVTLLEETLYGSDAAPPSLPDLFGLLTLFS